MGGSMIFRKTVNFAGTGPIYTHEIVLPHQVLESP